MNRYFSGKLGFNTVFSFLLLCGLIFFEDALHTKKGRDQQKLTRHSPGASGRHRHGFNPRTSSVQKIEFIFRTRTDCSIKLYINHTTMEPLNIGDTELRNHGTVEPWNYRTTEPLEPRNHWNHGTMEPRNHGTMEPWNHETMEPWNHGTTEPWNHETMEL